MVFLGIDPGTITAGYGIVKKSEKNAVLLDHGALCMRSGDPLEKRIAQFYDFFKEKILAYTITDIILETPFLGKNAQNFLKLGYLRGIIYLLAEKHGLRLHEYTPQQIKLAVTGWGGADKDQVARSVLRFFPGIPEPKKQDVTDALAVTLCGLWKSSSW